MDPLYNFGVFSYKALAGIASLKNSKAKEWAEGQQYVFSVWETGLERTPQESERIWFHAASVGEYEQCRPLLRLIKKERPRYTLLVSFFSPSAYRLKHKYNEADFYGYLPLDAPAAAKRFVKLLNPKAVFFAKYEFYHNYTKEIKKHGADLYCFSAIFRKKQVFFKPLVGSFFRDILKRFDLIFVQDKQSADLLRESGVSEPEVAGDTRFDQVRFICDSGGDIPVVETFCRGEQVFVAGSVWPADMEILYPLINETGQEIKYIIAPHEISQEFLEEIERRTKLPSLRYSQAQSGTPDAEARILIIDNIGLLSRIYKKARYAYVGGAFGKGLHNILEPAVYGAPVFFGPKYNKFKEAVRLVEKGGAFSRPSADGLKTMFYSLHKYPKEYAAAREVCQNYVEKNLGASQRIWNRIKKTDRI